MHKKFALDLRSVGSYIMVLLPVCHCIHLICILIIDNHCVSETLRFLLQDVRRLKMYESSLE